LSLFAHGPGGVEYLRIGGDVDAGFLLFFYRLPNIIVVCFFIRNVLFKGFIPHFLEFGFKFIAVLVKYSSAARSVSSLPGRPSFSLRSY
jgi:hypothetical protein